MRGQYIAAIVITSVLLIPLILIPQGIHRIAGSIGFPAGQQVQVTVIAALILGGWFLAVLVGGLTGFFNKPFTVFGIRMQHIDYLVILPVVAIYAFIVLSPTARALFALFTPERLMGVQVARLIGAQFLILYFTRRVPAIPAIPAGVGDVLIGATAPLMVRLYTSGIQHATAIAVAWNILGLVDFMIAVVLGHLAFTRNWYPVKGPSSQASYNTFPMILIPGFGVPLLIIFHLLTLRALL